MLETASEQYVVAAVLLRRLVYARSSPISAQASSRHVRARARSSPSRSPARRERHATSLAGLEAALDSGNAVAEELAIRRILLLYALAFATAARRCSTWATSSACATTRTGRRTPRTPPTTAGCTARRWTGRPRSTAATRGTVEGQIWAGLRRLASARRAARAVHAQGRSEPLWTSNHHVFALLREHAGERLLLLADFTPLEQAVQAGVATGNGFRPAPAAAVSGRTAAGSARGLPRPRALPVPLARGLDAELLGRHPHALQAGGDLSSRRRARSPASRAWASRRG